MENEVLYLKHYWSQIGPSDVTYRIFMKEYINAKINTWSLTKRARYFLFKNLEGIPFYSTIRAIISFTTLIENDKKMILSRDYDQKTPYSTLMASVSYMGVQQTYTSYRPFEYYDLIDHLEKKNADQKQM